MRYRFLRFPCGKPKAVTMSYDDGFYEDLKFSDIISNYGMKCTFNLNSRGIQRKDLSDDEIKEYILDRGHELAVHGAAHRAEGVLSPIQGIRDVLDCRLELEHRFKTIIRGMAYPDSGIDCFANSSSYEKIKGYLMDLDIAYARTLGKDNNLFLLPNDWYNWAPSAHHRNPIVMEYIDEFLNIEFENKTFDSMASPKLFFMWGHTKEFTIDNNWDHINYICDKLADKKDVWYCTNIELYEYVTAYNSLIFSADENIVSNPTAFDIWFAGDGITYRISPGETLMINDI